jgi:CRP/FNR family transcriptional regulator, anaerobic regulatory protein
MREGPLFAESVVKRGDNSRVVQSCFADRLGGFVELTAAERLSLARLEERERTLRRGAVLLREKDEVGELFILKRGTMMSYLLLDDGSRQILRFLYPGDMLAVSGLVYRRSPETVVALTEATVCPFERTALADLVKCHPRLAALLVALDQVERTALTDRLASLGRTSAKGRVAGLLLEVRNRLRAADRSIGTSFPLGLTQEEVGDATGLTAVHVNRMLRQLEDERLVARENGRVTLLDEAALARAANYNDRVSGIDLSWLPPAG